LPGRRKKMSNRFLMALKWYREQRRRIDLLEGRNREQMTEVVRLEAYADSLTRYIEALEGRDKERVARIEKLEARNREMLATIRNMRTRLAGAPPGNGEEGP
jgi:hypothetical protein